MIRTIVIVFCLFLFFLVSIPLLLVQGVLYLFGKKHRSRFMFRHVTAGLKMVQAITGVELTVIGEEHVPKDDAVLYIGNHQSYFDIVLSYARVPHYTGFVAKKEMLRYPVLAQLMICMDCVFLDRKDIRQGMETILACIGKIKEGVSICIYPEGTRNRQPDTFMEFRKGSFKIAQRTGCAIIPMTIVNSHDIFEAHIPFIRKTRVILEYGAPIYYKDLSKEDQKNIHLYCRDLIYATYEKNKALLAQKEG